MGLVLFEDRPVIKFDFDVAGKMARIIDGRIELVMDFFCQRENLWVLNRFIRKLFQSRPAADQHYRDAVGQTELGAVRTAWLLLVCQRLPQAVHRTFRRPTNDFDNSPGRYRIFLSELERAIHIGMRYRTARIGFESEPRNLPFLPQL